MITGTPTTPGTVTVCVTVTDSTGASSSQCFPWTILAASGGTCHVTYTRNSEWPGGFTAQVVIANTGTTAINGWSLTFTFPGDQKVTSAWNATVTQSGEAVTAVNVGYNGTVAPGGNASFGFQGTWTANDSPPTSFNVNGVNCT